MVYLRELELQDVAWVCFYVGGYEDEGFVDGGEPTVTAIIFDFVVPGADPVALGAVPVAPLVVDLAGDGVSAFLYGIVRAEEQGVRSTGAKRLSRDLRLAQGLSASRPLY